MVSTITGVITEITRGYNTAAGNPTWYVTVNGQTYRTSLNASVGYVITFGMVGKTATIDLVRKAGRDYIVAVEV